MRIDADIEAAQLTAFQRSLAEYLRVNRRANGPLIDKRALRVRIALMQAFRGIAPTKESLAAEFAVRGYRIRRGTTRTGKRRTIEQELKARQGARGYLAASLVYRGLKAAPRGRFSSLTAQSRRAGSRKPLLGQAVFRTAEGQTADPSVRITSMLAGASIQDRRRGLVRRVLAAEVQDMEAYLARKQQQRLARVARRDANPTVAP